MTDGRTPNTHTGRSRRPDVGRILGGLLLVALLFAGWTGCRTSPSTDPDPMPHPTHPPADTDSAGDAAARTYLGRFAVAEPSPLRRAGEDYTLHGLSVVEVAWPEDTAPGDAFDRHWQRIVAEVASESFRGTEPVDGVVVDERVVRDGLRAVLYRSGYAPDKMTWTALLRTDGGGVRLQRDTWAGDEDADLDALRTVAEAYAPQPPPADAGTWFHVGRGGFALPFQDRESAFARFVDGDVELSISFQSLREAPSRSVLQSLFEGAWGEAFDAFGGNTTSIRGETRTVAGREGREEIFRFTEQDGLWVHFSWNAPGQARSGTHPRIDIEMVAPADHYDSLLPLWEQTLSSLRSLSEAR
jgi:hypothetical protein